jgi:hypothetical protein
LLSSAQVAVSVAVNYRGDGGPEMARRGRRFASDILHCTAAAILETFRFMGCAPRPQLPGQKRIMAPRGDSRTSTSMLCRPPGRRNCEYIWRCAVSIYDVVRIDPSVAVRYDMSAESHGISTVSPLRSCCAAWKWQAP